jgi:hypothetical protein
MSLTWKDAAGTVLTAAAALVTFALLKGFDWPLLTSWRMGVLALFVIGIAACVTISMGEVPEKDGWNITASVIGGVAACLILLGLIFNSKAIFLLLAGDIIVLWILTTAHHLLTTRS